MAEMHHETIHFSGHVQGVGFRYAVLQVAREFEVTGYVKNLADGRVMIEVAGRAADVAAFGEAVQDKMHGYIRKVERSAGSGLARFSGFGIR